MHCDGGKRLIISVISNNIVRYSPGKDCPKDEELQCSLRCKVYHHVLKVVRVVVAVVGDHTRVVCPVLPILGKKVHALQAQSVHASLHVLLDLCPVQDCDVRLRWNQALLIAGVELDEPLPVLPLLGVLYGEGGVVGDPHVVQPGPVGAVRPVDCVELPVDLNFAASGCYDNHISSMTKFFQIEANAKRVLPTF